jgi:ATP-dependent helicase HrpB
LLTRWDRVVEGHQQLQSWLQRWKFLCQHKADFVEVEIPLQAVLEMAAYGRVSMAEVLAQDLVSFLESALDRMLVKQIGEQAPDKFLAPSGVAHAIDYSEQHSAFVDVRLQEIFGLLETPRLAWGQVPLTFRLLGPNFRPVQVTSDLASFWRTGYLEVRKELRTRYPKHSWPEDPYSAKPEAKGRRRT